MKDDSFGVEIELDGLAASDAGGVLKSYFGARPDRLGRSWRVKLDGSVPNGFEVVTPPISRSDFETLGDVLEALRGEGACRSRQGAVHVHVDARGCLVGQIVSLVNFYASFGRVLLRMHDVGLRRRLVYAQSLDPLARRLSVARSVISIASLKRTWYEVYGGSSFDAGRYDRSRYTELNLNSYFYRGTVEFRLYNSTDEVAEIAALVEFTLAVFRFAKSYAGIFPYARRAVSGLDEFVVERANMFEVLNMETAEFGAVRRYLLGSARGSWRSGGNGGPDLRLRAFGVWFAGGSCADLLDQMLESDLFSRPDLRGWVAGLRSRSKGKGSARAGAWIGNVVDDEEFAERVIDALVRLFGCSFSRTSSVPAIAPRR